MLPLDSIPGDIIPGDSIIPNDSIPADSIPGDSIPGDSIPGDSIPSGAIDLENVAFNVDGNNSIFANWEISEDGLPQFSYSFIISKKDENGNYVPFFTTGAICSECRADSMPKSLLDSIADNDTYELKLIVSDILGLTQDSFVVENVKVPAFSSCDLIEISSINTWGTMVSVNVETNNTEIYIVVKDKNGNAIQGTSFGPQIMGAQVHSLYLNTQNLNPNAEYDLYFRYGDKECVKKFAEKSDAEPIVSDPKDEDPINEEACKSIFRSFRFLDGHATIKYGVSANQAAISFNVAYMNGIPMYTTSPAYFGGPNVYEHNFELPISTPTSIIVQVRSNQTICTKSYYCK